MLLQIDGTLILQIVNFIVFLAVLNVVFLSPVGRALAARRAFINAIGDDYENAQNEIRALRASGDSRRLATRRECEELVTKARNDAAVEAETISTRAHSLAHERVVQAQATVTAELAAAKQREDALAHELANVLYESALGTVR